MSGPGAIGDPVFHGYCIRLVDQPGPVEGLTGVDGAVVEAVTGAGLAIWVSRSREAPPDADRLWRHEVVVRAALRTETPLPLRFGTRFRNAAAALDALEQRRDEFLAMLKEFAGQVEMGIRVTIDSAGALPVSPEGSQAGGAAPGGPSPGRAYLESRRRTIESRASRRDEIDASVASVEARMADLGFRSVRTALPGEPPVGGLAHLVPRAQVRSYRDRLTEVQLAMPHVRLAVSGPWAPYSFVR